MNKNEFQKYLELQNKGAFLEIFDVFVSKFNDSKDMSNEININNVGD